MATFNFPSDFAGFTPGSSSSDTGPLNIGTIFALSTATSITGARFYSPVSQSVSAQLWESGVKVAETTGFSATTGWNTISFGTPYSGVTGVDYIVSILLPSGAIQFSVALSKFGAGVTPISVTVGAAYSNTTANGKYTYGTTIPATNGSDSPWYGVDVVMDDGASPDGTVAAVRANGSGLLRPPVLSTGSGGSVTAVRATGSGLAQPPALSGSSLVVGAQPMLGSGTMFGGLAVSVTGGLVNGQVQAVRATGVGRGIVPRSPGQGDTVLSITQVRFRPRRADGALAQGVPMTGTITARPTARNTIPQGELLPIGFTIQFSGQSEVVQTMQANSLPTWAWEFTEQYPDGRGGMAKMVTTRNIPPSGVTLDFERLELVDPNTLTPLTELTSTAELRLRQVEQAVATGGGGSGGSVYSTGILDSTQVGRSVVTAANQNAARTAIDAAQAFHTHSTSQINATGTPSSTTALFGDNTWKTISGTGTATWPISGTPSTFPPSPHTHPSTDINDATSIGRQILTAVDAATVLSLIGGTGTTDVDDLPPGSVVFAAGAGTPRPTTRSDIVVLWIAASVPSNSLPGDIWLNGPDS